MRAPLLAVLAVLLVPSALAGPDVLLPPMSGAVGPASYHASFLCYDLDPVPFKDGNQPPCTFTWSRASVRLAGVASAAGGYESTPSWGLRSTVLDAIVVTEAGGRNVIDVFYVCYDRDESTDGFRDCEWRWIVANVDARPLGTTVGVPLPEAWVSIVEVETWSSETWSLCWEVLPISGCHPLPDSVLP